ncbi:MAG: hypothetical protein ACYTEZ_08160 [Planctomycetota bacterium]|jgi:hypothetical protein
MKSGVVALALSALALGAAVFSLTRESPPPGRAAPRTDRVAAVEAQVAELTRELESLKAQKSRPIRRDPSGGPSGTPHPDAGDFGSPSDVAEDDPALAAIVDDAVDRKTKRVLDELRIKANKKPAMDVFASMLELTDEQRAATERVVVDGQRQVHAILDTPTADGTNLMNGLVEIVARRIAEPGRDHGFGRWFARIASEKIPGMDETYGARIESVKNAMRATFKRYWSAAQYREFEEWGVDPTEIEKVPGSPNAELWMRIAERARTLGADIPDDQ